MQPAIVKDLKERLTSVLNNPASIQRTALETLRQIHEGEVEVVDAATPFGFLLQNQAVLVSSFLDESIALTRKQYPVAAQTEDELYLHMSDRDYVNRFAMPAKARFRFVFDKDELLQKLVEDVDLGIRKLIIPRHTEIQVNDLIFTLQYPIEIRQLQHGGIQILYNTNIESPVQTLETNIINYRSVKDNNVEWLGFEITVPQLKIRKLYSDTDDITNPEEDIILTDEYYYLRAFIHRNGTWEEIKTTHTEQIYDITKLTAVLKVYDDRVNVRIPQIYTTQGLINGRLRFDLYETRGDINADLSVYPPSVFTMKFAQDDYDPSNSIYTAPLKNFKTLSISSEDITEGGNRKMSFEELREVVVNNSAGAQVMPITPIQAETSLRRNGYDIVKNIDNVTNRSFLATKQLPQPQNIKLVTPASASIESVIITEKEAAGIGSIKKNFRSMTITPKTLFENKNGVMKLVPSAKVEAIKALRPELIANEVTVNNYFYTPFHYVMDFGLEEFHARPYYLDKPKVLYKSFVSDNDRTLMQVSVKQYEIVVDDEGYKLLIEVESSDNYKAVDNSEVFVQMAFKPKGESYYAYLNGELLGVSDDDERIFRFNLGTNYYVDNENELSLTEFKMFTLDDRIVKTALENDFELLFGTLKQMPPTWEPDEVDEKLGRFMLPANAKGICNERIRIRFGHALENLWSRHRSIITANDYLRYTADVPMVYENDIYDIDPVTGSAARVDPRTNKVTYNKLHSKGDPVLDSNGNPVMKHKVGDPVLGPNGKPSFNDEFGLIRQLDILMVEGAYWFATDQITQEYRQEITDTFVNWIVDGLGALTRNLLEQTRIYFYPKSTVGQIEVMVNNSVRTSIDSGQRFKITLHVSSIVYSNASLKKEITEASVRVLSDILKNDVVSNSDITERLKDAYGEDVISFKVEGLGGGSRIDVITILNDAKRCSLRKRLVAQGDGSLIVEEDVTCDFVRHDKKEMK